MDTCNNVHPQQFYGWYKTERCDWYTICHVISRIYQWMCLHRLKKRVNKNLLKFNKEQCKVLYLGRNSPMCLYKLGMNQGPTQRMTWWSFHRTPLCTPVEKKKRKKESVLGFIKQSVISRQEMRSFSSAHHWWDTSETSPAESHDSEQQIEASVTGLQAEGSQLPAVEVEVQTESICILDGGKWRRWILDCSQWCPVAGI